MPTKPRGVRNNNPGNIDRSRTPWQGEDRSAAALRREKRFCVFLTPAAGFRALARLMLTYRNKHGLRTVAQIIHRWAPPTENDTNAYAVQVARAVGVSPDTAIDVTHAKVMFAIVKAIAHHESGGDFWPDETIKEGIAAAGVSA